MLNHRKLYIYLMIDGKRRHLQRHAYAIHRTVDDVWLKLFLFAGRHINVQLDDAIARRRPSVGLLHQIEQRGKVHAELQQYRRQRVQVEDVGQRCLLGEHLQWLGPNDEQETGGNEEALQRGLGVAEFDAVHVEHRLAVGLDEGVQCEDFEHLQCGD